VVEAASPSFLARNWALPEWSTRSVRDAFYASPKLPRLLNADSVRETIAKGVRDGFFAYAGKQADGSYEPFHFRTHLASDDIRNRCHVIRRTQGIGLRPQPRAKFSRPVGPDWSGTLR
jgi:hypothetical protein